MLFNFEWTTVNYLSLIELVKLSIFVNTGLIAMYPHGSIAVASLEGINATWIAIFWEKMRSDHENSRQRNIIISEWINTNELAKTKEININKD